MRSVPMCIILPSLCTKKNNCPNIPRKSLTEKYFMSNSLFLKDLEGSRAKSLIPKDRYQRGLQYQPVNSTESRAFHNESHRARLKAESPTLKAESLTRNTESDSESPRADSYSKPSSFASAFHFPSTSARVLASITISSGQGRANPSVDHFRVASIPIFEP